jgi:hypothetical protein
MARETRLNGRSTDWSRNALRGPEIVSEGLDFGQSRCWSAESGLSPGQATLRRLPTSPQRASQRLPWRRERARATTTTDANVPAEEKARSYARRTAVASETQMHFAKVRAPEAAGDARHRGNEAQDSRSLGTLGRVEPDRERSDRRALRIPLGDPEFRAKYEHLYAEMLEQLAPASEGPVVNPGGKRRGRLVFGDDTGEHR